MKITKQFPNGVKAKDAGAISSTFQYQGHIYTTVRVKDSVRTNLRADKGFIPAMNLTSRTIRGIPENDIVYLCEVEAIVKPWAKPIPIPNQPKTKSEEVSDWLGW